MPSLNAKNISEVRDEYDRISKAITRFSIVRATIIGIAAFVLASGLNAISSSEVNKIVDDLKANFQITQVSPEFNDTFLSAIYSRSFIATPSPTPAANTPDQAVPVVSEEQKQQAQNKENELVEKLKAEAQKAFDLSLTAPLLGTKIDVDLRFWGFLIPILVIFSETYLAILRYKRRLVFKIGSLMTRRDPDNASSWSLIQFSERHNRLPPLLRYPAQYEWAVSCICGIALAYYVGASGKQFWDSWDSGSKIFLLEIYIFIAIYAVAYVAYAQRQLRSQILPFRGLRRPQLSGPGLAHVLTRRGADFLRRVPAKLNLVSGSLFALCTLWLVVASGCEGTRTGYQYLRKPGTGWLSGPLDVSDWFDKSYHPYVVWTFYLAGILLAAVSLILVWRFQNMRNCRKFASRARDLAAVTCMFFVTNLCFGDLLSWTLTFEAQWNWLNLIVLVPALLIWVVPIAAWIQYRQKKFRFKRRALLRWYQPQIAFATFFCLADLFTNRTPRIGVPVFVAGVALVAAAYAAFARSRSAAAVPRQRTPILAFDTTAATTRA